MVSAAEQLARKASGLGRGRPGVRHPALVGGLAASEGWPLALSEAFASMLPGTPRLLGRFQLKGLPDAVPAFAPV